MTASVRASAITPTNLGGASIAMNVPVGAQAGDLLLAVVTTGSSITISDAVTKGWWEVTPRTTYGTRVWWVFGRVYNPSDAASTYTFTQSAAAGVRGFMLAIQDHAVTQAAHITQSPFWTRTANGGSQALVRAPGVVAPQADMLNLALTGEATNTAGGYTTTSIDGFTMVTEIPEDSNLIEWITAWTRVQATADTTPNFDITYAHVGSNAGGAQFLVPSAVAQSAPATGRIGLHVVTSVDSGMATVGFDRLGGTNVEVEVNGVRIGAVADSASGWGYATFTGLAPSSTYPVQFYVDGTLQTDAPLVVKTYPVPGVPASFVMVTGSCQFTGSNHPIWDRIREDSPAVLAHMGDLHYADTGDETTWRNAVESSLTAPRMKALLEQTPLTWTWDNHDRIMINDGGAGTALNLGITSPATLSNWRKLAGTQGWASNDTAGRSWVIGRVRFVQTDHWTVRQDADAGLPAPITMMGAAQKAWFKTVLENATEEVIVWLCQWTGQEHANGRWNSFPDETQELENWINDHPSVKSKMVMIGGDSHSLQVTDGTRTRAQGQRFAGIPNWNISGFNRTSTAGVGTPGWLIDSALRTSAQPEADWGGYSRITVTDTGTTLTMHWEGIRVGPTGATDLMYEQTITKGGNGWAIEDTATGERLTPIYWDGTTETPLVVDSL